MSFHPLQSPPTFILATRARDRAPGPRRFDLEFWIPLPPLSAPNCYVCKNYVLPVLFSIDEFRTDGSDYQQGAVK